ncbi:MAG TPA: hypothetical protein PKA27_15210 [Fimbriimonadaceae bacterium]|nr:hypothetical protein [Fimbriimonadaceae bacterium]
MLYRRLELDLPDETVDLFVPVRATHTQLDALLNPKDGLSYVYDSGQSSPPPPSPFKLGGLLDAHQACVAMTYCDGPVVIRSWPQGS